MTYKIKNLAPVAGFLVLCLSRGALYGVVHMDLVDQTWIFAETRFTFSLGRGVDHVPGHHKPQKWTIQTHSFSEHPKIFESTKYKYIFGSTEVDEILKKSYEFYQNRSQIWARTMILCSHTDPTMNSWSSWKTMQYFVDFFNLSKFISGTLYLF